MSITATIVPENMRLSMFPKYFQNYVGVENAIYDMARSLSQDYDGGYWEFVVLSNNGFFIMPSKKMYHVINGMNWSEEDMDEEAFGLTCTIMVMSHYSFQVKNDTELESVVKNYDALREYAYDHKYASAIMAILD